jgi:hypothetical protein
MLKKLTMLLIAAAAAPVLAQDTTLGRQFQVPYPVNSEAVDADGMVLICGVRGREIWSGDGFKVVDPCDFNGVSNWNAAVLTHEAFAATSGKSPHEHFRHWGLLLRRGAAHAFPDRGGGKGATGCPE